MGGKRKQQKDFQFSTWEDVSKFVALQRELIDIERDEEEQEKLKLKQSMVVEPDTMDVTLGKRNYTMVKRVGSASRVLRLGVGECVNVRATKNLDINNNNNNNNNNKTNANDQVYSGVVSMDTDKSITVSMNMMPDEMWESPKLFISRAPNSVTYKRTVFALDMLADIADNNGTPSRFDGFSHVTSIATVAYGLQSPQHQEDMQPLRMHDKSLNESQQEAVQLAMRSKDVSLILGPPGTGKTTTVVEVVRQAVKRKERVLVCAPSNVAVDNVVEKLSGKKISMVRLGHPARIMDSVLHHTLPARIRRSENGRIGSDIRKEIQQLLRKIKKEFNKKRRAMSQIREWRREVRELEKELKKRDEMGAQDVVSSSQVVLSTLSGAADRWLKGEVFDLVVIDEAAQSLEASSWIALSRGKRCVLAGDPFQLPPTVMSDKASSQGLGMSLMERLHNMYSDTVTRMLQTQFRMHSLIMEWSSDEFYQGKLHAHDSVASHLLYHIDGVTEQEETIEPLMFIDTTGCELYEEEDRPRPGDNDEEVDLGDNEEKPEYSKFNAGEAKIVTEHVHTLLRAGVKQSDLAVITPYSAQVSYLRSLLAEDHPSLEIGTVDGFQGREKEAVVFSMVRSNDDGEVGFLSDTRRTNVAITRARRHVCVVGDSGTLASSDFLERMVEYFENVGYVRTAADYVDS